MLKNKENNSLKKSEFFGINALRFIAAFWVLIFHASMHFGKLPDLILVQPLIDQGVLAMTLFFMLSGFVLSYRYQYFDSKDDWILFFSARIARLYPLYIFMGLITLWLLPESFLEYDLPVKHGIIGEAVFSVVLVVFFLLAIQAWFPALFNVWNFGGSWSLSVEAFFYLLFPKLRSVLTAFDNKLLCYTFFLLPIIMMIIFSGMLVSLTEADNLKMFYVLPILRLPEFILGVAGYILFVERGMFISLLNRISIFLAVFVLIGIFTKNLPGLIDYGWIASIPFLSIFILSMKIKAPLSIQLISNYLGSISYSVYLTQFLTTPVLKRYSSDMSVEFSWIALITLTLVVSIFSHHFIESILYKKTFSLSQIYLTRISIKNA